MFNSRYREVDHDGDRGLAGDTFLVPLYPWSMGATNNRCDLEAVGRRGSYVTTVAASTPRPARWEARRAREEVCSER